MYRNQGNWTFAMYDYWIEQINGEMDNPNLQKMCDEIDAYTYSRVFSLKSTRLVNLHLCFSNYDR